MVYLFIDVTTSSNQNRSCRICLVWFGLVLWHSKHYGLFNAKCSLYMCIKHMISKHIVFITFLNELELIFILLS